MHAAGVKAVSPAKRGRSEATRLDAGEHTVMLMGPTARAGIIDGLPSCRPLGLVLLRGRLVFGILAALAEFGRLIRAAAAVRPIRLARRPTRAPGRVAPAHHELLDLAPVVRRPGGAVSVVASGLGPGPSSGHHHIPYFRGADKSSLSDPAVLTQE